jgi:hypothetical protein
MTIQPVSSQTQEAAVSNAHKAAPPQRSQEQAPDSVHLSSQAKESSHGEEHRKSS